MTPFGGGVLGANAGDGGREKRDGGDTTRIATLVIGAAAAAAGTAGDTARSNPPVISSQKHGPSLGTLEWLPCGWGTSWVWCAMWCRQARSAWTATPPGPATSQEAAARRKSASVGTRRMLRKSIRTVGWRKPG